MSSTDEDILRMLSVPSIPEGVARCPDRDAYARSFYNHAKPKDFKLRDIQVDGAYTYETQGGMISPCSVGGGKTLLTLLCAKVAIERRKHRRVAILVPAEVYSQLTERDLPQARKWLSLDAIPFYVVSGSAQERKRMATQQGIGVFIYAYSSLSTQTGYEELAAINPTCFVMDEAHMLSRFTAARTKRWHSCMKAIQQNLEAKRAGPDVQVQQVEVCAMSGTITKKSVEDYAHISRAALREASPAPIHGNAISLLGSCIDAAVVGENLTDLDIERMKELINWARQHGRQPKPSPVAPTFQEMVRDAYQYRLRTAPGVVGTSEDSVGCSLILSWSEPPRPQEHGGERLAKLMEQVVVNMLTPNGDVIDFGMHTYKWLWELTAGFYNSLTWPTADRIREASARRGKPISPFESEALLQKALEHHGLLQAYHKLLRRFLDREHQPGCDTPLLVAQEILREPHQRRFRLPGDLIQAYQVQRAARFDDLPERFSVPVRICDYKVKAAVEWCRAYQKTGGFVWFHHPEIGKWLSELLIADGQPHTLALAGDNEAAYKPGIVLASYAHATGKNLQHQSRNLVLELRREAAVMEQMLGRTHRSGQKADDVRADLLISNGFDLALFNSTLRDSDYIQSTTGQQQKLCYATYAPVIPPTNPRLAVRLGIVQDFGDAQSVHAEAHETITPTEALNWADVFRSVRFEVKSKPKPP